MGKYRVVHRSPWRRTNLASVIPLERRPKEGAELFGFWYGVLVVCSLHGVSADAGESAETIPIL